jgi:glutamate synthase (NADPH/NADH) small chain
MDPQTAPGRNPKYAWRDVARAEAPKRSARDRISDFRAVYNSYDDATASEQASRCIQCPNPSCVEACPLGMPIPDLLRLTADGQFEEAARLLNSKQSMPELFVHICSAERLCEAACILADQSEPVSISSIARFLLDFGWNHGLFDPPAGAPTGQHVAIIGSGLCGLVAADGLSRMGYTVTVFDACRKPGGRLVNGLPGFRVDRDLIERRVRLLAQRGVRFQNGMICGRDLKLGALRRDFDAVFFGLGRANPVRLDAPGSKLRGVRQGYSFVLRNTSNVVLQSPPVLVHNKRVIVLGGGETAVDALRVAIRCGASEAICAYRRDFSDLSASRKEIDNAIEEGARFLNFTQAVKVIGNAAGDVAGVRCVRTAPDLPDALGRRTVSPIAGSEFEIPADVVLVAYGFEPPKLTQMDEFSELSFDNRGFLMVDPDLMTNLPGVFAGGSVVRGSVPLVTIVGDSSRAAASIDRYLSARRANAA